MDTAKKYYTDDNIEHQPVLYVGDLIEFDYFNELKRGRIIVIGKYGYWINDTTGCTGNGAIRCPFGKEHKI